jgi:hypothetical protein
MSWWNSSTSEQRIDSWAEFREQISNDCFDTQLKRVAEYFAEVPLGGRVIDYYTPSSWPSPWEILHHGIYCRSTTGILMYDTLKILNKDAPIDICRIDDQGDVYLAPVTNYGVIINLILGEISNLDTYSDVKIIENFHGTLTRQYT